MIRITLTGATREVLFERLQQAYRAAAPRLIRRIHVLLCLAEGKAVAKIAEMLGLGEQTVRDCSGCSIASGAGSTTEAWRARSTPRPTRRSWCGSSPGWTVPLSCQDNAPYHTSSVLRQFYADHSDRLTVYQLPPYSPDLSPIEGLWKKAKKDAIHLRYFREFAHLVTKVEETLTRFTELPHELTALAGEYRSLTPLAA